jgi:hypothetical protein
MCTINGSADLALKKSGRNNYAGIIVKFIIIT